MEQLDIPAAETYFRTAHQLAGTGRGSSHAQRLAGATLGDLLYEQGNIADADRLLDASHELGPEGGGVDFMLATYGTGARIKVLLGDLEAADERLREAAEIAETLSLPRMAARIENERIRAGLVNARYGRQEQAAEGQLDGIAVITSELQSDSTVRLLLKNPATKQIDLAVTLAAELLRQAEQCGRPRAALRARLLLVCAQTTMGDVAGAVCTLIPAIITCAEKGLVRAVLDAGPRIGDALDALTEELSAGEWPEGWSSAASTFLASLPGRPS
ncbi:hypothetical protein EEB14_31865 [Rhodococcus sp. WS4]|nr:hypothetical protein EEB14_31865 [Rhodococcus sp. WS4]